ncbi:PDDEXK nuclease domain-containing protein [Segatella bryantii]|uniref:PDDEXK nuclease domain-containing protein n=1 Tax=Segatella bryantii TaxID=77095 RepID=UPI00241ED9AC|nr:PDDEXK nuclease domain-containing protein [Segatella bryantii]
MSNKQDDSLDNPHMVKSHDIHIDAEYAEWIAELKHRYRSAQVKAAIKVNAEKLLFNWQLGRDLVQKKAEERWGAGVVEQVSLDLKREFPNENGFSTSNLWYMKKWYLFYANPSTIEKLHQLGGEFPLPFALVPWRHHVEIITKSKSIEEALFYVGKTIEQGLSRDALINCFKAHLYEHQGKIVNNFSDHLPNVQSRLVQEVLKENYDFSFATVEHDPYEERELEDALTKDVTDLLLEMGTGFAFVGRQKEIVVGGRSRKIDLLFYHIRLRCYIACEIKVKPFEPEFAGKLNYYVNAVDELLKTDDDNPTIGLLVCSDMNKTDVQWSFRGISTPMGVATYNNIKIKDALPSQEQLAERVRLLQKELQETKRLMNKNKE